MPLIAGKILIGFLVGTLIGLTGLGGGVLLLPLLIFGLHVPAITAVGSDALFNFCTKIGSSWMHLRKGTVRRKVVVAMAVGSVPGSYLGVTFLTHLRIRLRDRRQRFHQISDRIAAGLHPDFAVVPRTDRGARCESSANDEVIYRDDDHRPVRRISGWHDVGWIWKHHHDASSAVLQLPSQGDGGHGYCSRRNSHRHDQSAAFSRGQR